MEQVQEVAVDMTLALELFFKAKVNVLGYTIQLINTSFKTGQAIRIEDASKALKAPKGILVLYDKERYHGIQASH